MAESKASIEQSIIDKVRSRAKSAAIEKDTAGEARSASAIRNSTLASWWALRGDKIPIPKLGPSEERVMVYLMDKMQAAKPGADTSYIEEDIEWMVCNLYGLTDEERLAVTTSQRGELPALTEEKEDLAMLQAIKQGETWNKDEEFLKHEEMMRKLLGRDEC